MTDFEATTKSPDVLCMKQNVFIITVVVSSTLSPLLLFLVWHHYMEI